MIPGIAMSPDNQGPLVGVHWNVDFKSNWVSKNVIQKLDGEQDIAIQQLINFFKTPQKQEYWQDSFLSL